MVCIDIQLLKKKNLNLFLLPPSKFLNPKSVSSLLNKNGFNVLEAITPGRLDIDILSKNQHHIKDPFGAIFLNIRIKKNYFKFKTLFHPQIEFTYDDNLCQINGKVILECKTKIS